MWGSCGGVSGCSPVCAGPWLRGGVGCVMRSHMFSSSVPQAGREHRSWGTPGICKKRQRQACTSKRNPRSSCSYRGTRASQSTGLASPILPSQPSRTGHSLTSSLLGTRLSGPPLPLCIFPLLLENGATKRLLAIF